jgi:ELWxxDGT repeat protein
LFFNAYEPTTGSELWKSDGTAAGTVLVKDINPATEGSSPWAMAAVGNTLFFVAYEPTTGYGLWKSDGTAAGTELIKSIDPGEFNGDPFSFRLMAAGNTLFFVTFNWSSYFYELWKTDGTVAGTGFVAVLDWYGSSFLYLNPMAVIGNTLFFRSLGSSGHELWTVLQEPWVVGA